MIRDDEVIHDQSAVIIQARGVIDNDPIHIGDGCAGGWKAKM